MPEKPTPTPEDIAEKSVPTRMEQESKEFVEELGKKEYEETKTRHRSTAQLERHGAEAKKGHLVVTPEQIENARKVMNKELERRGLGERVGTATEKFFRSAEESIDRVTKRLAPVWKRGRRVWGKVKEADYGKFVGLVLDLPSNFSQEISEIAIKRAEKLEARRDERVATFRESLRKLREESAQRRTEWREKKEEEISKVREEVQRRYRLLAETWGSDSGDLGLAVQEKKDEAYDTFVKWVHEQEHKFSSEIREFTEAEEAALQESTEELGQKLLGKTLPIYERLRETLEIRDKWSYRAKRAREVSGRLKGLLGIEVQNEN